MRPFLAGSHVLVLPTRLREGVPRTILEAMASGRPVITTDAPGCGETVGDGDGGFVVPVGDADALAAAMRRFLDDPDLAARMGAAGRARVEAQFRRDLIWREILALLREMAPAARPRPPVTGEAATR